MDQKLCGEGGHSSLDLKCKKVLHGADKSIACQTPEKTTEPLHIIPKDGATQLPDKAIADLFDRMSCSLRLLNLRKKSPTFQNICTQVEVLAKRKFSYMHLAQMKHILPEALHVDKILIHNKKTLCMELDMTITLLFDVVEGHSGDSAYRALQQVFISRLIEFFHMHPKASDIPEAILPAPFGRRNQSSIPADFSVDSLQDFQEPSQIDLFSEKSHTYPSFCRHISQKGVDQTEGVQYSESPIHSSSARSDYLDNQDVKSGDQKGYTITNPESVQEKELSSISTYFKCNIINTPDRLIYSQCSDSISELPDTKLASSADSLMTKTPAQSAPGRLILHSDVKPNTITSQKSTSYCKPAKRVLDFLHLEGDKGSLDFSMDNLEFYRAADSNIPQAPRGCHLDDNATDSVLLPQEVEKSHGYSDEDRDKIQTGPSTCLQMSSCLLDLVPVIHSIFKSVNCSPITKEELLHKIIMNSLDFFERREIEEKIELLEKVVPDWICRKLVPSGDIMYCIKKVPDLDSVLSRLSRT
ncbi:CDT1-like protein a, chloroplastic [Quillaja saponaria]|uniref:CDT1-like protein a, chloroplastic n=1 Tax=Quillaja saponaria TaxID=32244 RepID=A0AAD7Q6M1_QUISA|nr:CDT1-like protein a, chloroplastic [Quillaja saponaria]